MTVSREEFDNLVTRVDRIERTLAATVEIVSAEVVGLRTYLDERFAAVDRRFDGMDARFDASDARLDSYTAQVQQAIKLGSDAAARNERFARAIADHFGIQLDDAE